MKSWVSIILGAGIIFLGGYLGFIILDNFIIYLIFLVIGGFVATYLSDEKKFVTSLCPGLITIVFALLGTAYVGNSTSSPLFMLIISLILMPLIFTATGGFLAVYLTWWTDPE